MDYNTTLSFHIEITELKDFVNMKISEHEIYPIQGRLVFKTMKDAVIGAGVNPFLIAQNKAVKDLYYEKYYNLYPHPEYKDKYIPAFSINKEISTILKVH